jgi:hypothetical protein
VLFIILVAVLAGAEDAEAVEDFAYHHEDWFGCGSFEPTPKLFEIRMFGSRIT